MKNRIGMGNSIFELKSRDRELNLDELDELDDKTDED